MKILVVNADDFGLTTKVNQGILDGHRNGIITSTTLLANGEALDSAVGLARQAPQLGIGVHLNLTQGRPISPASAIPSLVNGRGLFAWTPAKLWQEVLLRKVKRSEIERELRAQIEKVLAAGILVTHVDGHKHVHNLPDISEIVIRLAREYGIRGFRCVVERWADLSQLLRKHPPAAFSILKNHFKGRALACLAWRLPSELRRAGLVSPSHFIGLTQTGFLDADALRRILSNLPEGAGELMCHPGYVDDELRKIPTRLVSARERELEALTLPDIRRYARENGIQLVNYRDLAEAADGKMMSAGNHGPALLRDPSASAALPREVSTLAKSHQ